MFNKIFWFERLTFEVVSEENKEVFELYMRMRTFSLKAGDIQQRWYLIDVKTMVLGRVAAIIAKLLRGKNDPRMTPHLDHGACVVIVNARQVHITGQQEKLYYRHTGYPGGIKVAKASDLLEGAFPDRVMRKAVERMMGYSGPLRRQRMKNLFIYEGGDHPHQAQKPEVLNVSDWSVKNCKKES